ncbi:MAG: arsenate reductase [Acidobacteria bacterium]|jgi:arsenate reductase|nr:MAG: arsenate reductase [Acidobacteriota bacterium]GIU81192.1 MAG: arsenate reductase (glutaredoxin) [Pyrinomonadaceae bacterium]
MKKIIVYEKPTCTTCRNLAKWFEENGIDYEKVNYYIEPLTEEKLKELLKKAGLRAYDVLRKKEPAFKNSGITEQTPDDEIIKAIIANPDLLQRPIVEVGEKAVLARPIEKVKEIL